MERKGFERMNDSNIKNMSEVNFGIRVKMEGYTNISSDLPRLSKIGGKGYWISINKIKNEGNEIW